MKNNLDNIKIAYNGEPLYNILLEKYKTLKVNNVICESLHERNLIAKSLL